MENLSFGSQLNETNTVSSDPVYNNNIILAIGLPIFLENVFAVFILMRCEKLVFQIRYLSMNLSLADCLVGLILATPAWMFEYIFFCRVKKYFYTISIACSLTTATLINLDRCLSIYYNMRYFEIVTKKRLRAACVFAWIWAIFVSYIMYFTTESSIGIQCEVSHVSESFLYYVSTTVIKLTLVINVPMFLYMVYYVRKRMIMPPMVTDNGVELRKHASVRERTIRKVAVITGFFLACNSPASVLMDLDAATESPAITNLKMIAGILVFMNSFINPLLYVWRYYETRYQLLMLLYKCNETKAKELFQKRQQYFSSFEIRTHS